MLTSSIGSLEFQEVLKMPDASRQDLTASSTRVTPLTSLSQQSRVQGNTSDGRESPLRVDLPQDRADLSVSEQETANPSELASSAERLQAQAQERFSAVVKQINERLSDDLSLRFRKDEDTGINYFQIIEKETGDVIRQYPPDEMLKLVENLRDMQGLLVSKQA
jgi:flagellar protein FlaG